MREAGAVTLKTYRAFKRFHKRSVRLRGWLDKQDYYSPIIGILGAALLVAWLWS